jgi:hypothetical protein
MSEAYGGNNLNENQSHQFERSREPLGEQLYFPSTPALTMR